MDAQGWALVIGSTATGIGFILSAVFTGLIALAQARQGKTLSEVHESTNGAKAAAEAAYAELAAENRDLRRAALDKSDEALSKSEATIQEGKR